MLTNAYLLAKIGADTAENEQHFAEILPKTGRAGPRHGAHRLRDDDAPLSDRHELHHRGQAACDVGQHVAKLDRFNMGDTNFRDPPPKRGLVFPGGLNSRE